MVLILDGLVIKRKTGLGTKGCTILVAFGILLDGQKEIIDFGQVPSEKQVHWEAFLHGLYEQSLRGENLKLVIGNGGRVY